MKFLLFFFTLYSISIAAQDAISETSLSEIIPGPSAPEVSFASTPATEQEAPITIEKEVPHQLENRPNLMVAEILGRSEIKISIYGQHLSVGEKLSLISKDNNEVLGHVKVLEIQKDEQGNEWARARLIVHSKNAIPLVGDNLDKIDLSDQTENYPGRGDLLVFSGEDLEEDKKSISARYRPLVDQGLLIGETASTLARREHFFHITSKYGYGLTSKLSLSTLAALNIAGIYNAQVKYNVFRNEDFLISPTVGLSHWSKQIEQKDNVSLGLYVDILTNSKLISHSSITWSMKGKIFGKKDPTQSNLTTSSIQSGYEYILDNWDRFLLGPRYYFDSQSVGGYISYMMVWDHFHINLGVNSTDISKFKLGKGGMLPFLDLFWRL